MAATRPPDPSLVEAVFNHIALPPRLPGSQDVSIERIEHQLIDRLLNATSQLAASLKGDEIVPLRRSLEIAKRVNANGRLTKSTLLTAFSELEANEFIIAHVREQNAALLIRKQQRLACPFLKLMCPAN